MKGKSIIGQEKPIAKQVLTMTSIKSEIIKVTSLSSEAELKQLGFTGFVPIKSIIKDYSILPSTRGVYVMLYPLSKSQFIEISSGGAFKGRNPNVLIDVLYDNWVEKTSIIYIGKIGGEVSRATLRARLKQYFRFGQGEAVGHCGRYIWQLKNTQDIIVCWKEMPKEEPRTFEKQLIATFVKQFGKRPFANLVG